MFVSTFNILLNLSLGLEITFTSEIVKGITLKGITLNISYDKENFLMQKCKIIF